MQKTRIKKGPDSSRMNGSRIIKYFANQKYSKRPFGSMCVEITVRNDIQSLHVAELISSINCVVELIVIIKMRLHD